MKKSLLTRVLALLVAWLLTQPTLAAGYEEGKQYKLVPEPQPTNSADKVEVLEFFWYGCPHCYTFEPLLNNWSKSIPANVELIRVPAVFRPDWKITARTYYALQEMGATELYHQKIFDQIHKQRKPLNTLDAMTDFLVAQGVDKAKFTEHYNSFAVDGLMRKAIMKQTAFDITGVPSVIVNGKYQIDAKSAGSYENLLKVLDYLIQKEAAAMKAKAALTPALVPAV
jgi:thiol:disulfide interchange protein DsbA